jgi:dTDP-4-amino-4,6-dideoxygalactose transaminase
LSQGPGVVLADQAHCRCAKAQEAWLESTGAKVVLPAQYSHNEHIWNQYTLRVIGAGRRDALKDFLTQRKVGCEIYYPITMDQQKCFADTPAASRQGCEVAHRLAAEAISIPIYPELTDAQKAEVAGAIEEFLVGGGPG